MKRSVTLTLALSLLLASTVSAIKVNLLRRQRMELLREGLLRATSGLGLGDAAGTALMIGLEDSRVAVRARPSDILATLPTHTNPNDTDAPHAIFPPTASVCQTFAVRELVVEHTIRRHDSYHSIANYYYWNDGWMDDVIMRFLHECKPQLQALSGLNATAYESEFAQGGLNVSSPVDSAVVPGKRMFVPIPERFCPPGTAPTNGTRKEHPRFRDVITSCVGSNGAPAKLLCWLGCADYRNWATRPMP